MVDPRTKEVAIADISKMLELSPYAQEALEELDQETVDELLTKVLNVKDETDDHDSLYTKNELEDRVDDLEEEVDDLEATISRMSNDLADRDKTNSNLRERIAELKDNNDSHKLLEQLKKDNDHLYQESSERLAESLKLDAEVTALRDAINKLAEELGGARKTISLMHKGDR